MTANSYRNSWDGYWSSLSGGPDEVFWDSAPAHAAALDLRNFGSFFDPSLPLVDFGCGNGTQTRFLADHFRTVVGLDVSPVAIQAAAASAPNLTYRVADILDGGQAAALHAEMGDSNLYVRTVLHQLAPEDQVAAASVLRLLMGSRGMVYLIELSSGAEPYFQSVIREYGMPPQLARVFEHNIHPGILDENDVEKFFPASDSATVAAGASVIQTVHMLPTGQPARVPAFYRVIAARPQPDK